MTKKTRFKITRKTRPGMTRKRHLPDESLPLVIPDLIRDQGKDPEFNSG
jgi:hypothetical protein